MDKFTERHKHQIKIDNHRDGICPETLQPYTRKRIREWDSDWSSCDWHYDIACSECEVVFEYHYQQSHMDTERVIKYGTL